MIQFLHASPSLLELNIQGWSSLSITKSFLVHFAQYEGSEDSKTLRLVPMLHTIKVDYAPRNFDITGFVDAIQSRMTLNAFKRIEICYETYHVIEPFNPVTVSRLRQWRDIGVEVQIFQGTKDLLQV